MTSKSSPDPAHDLGAGVTEAKHTPGPWFYTPSGSRMRDRYSQPFGIAEGGTANLIAGCFGDVRGGHEIAEANARLIAAAPDLATALKAVLARYIDLVSSGDCGHGNDYDPSSEPHVKAARAALAKIAL